MSICDKLRYSVEMCIRDSFNITPDVAIVDPELAEKMPPKLTAHTGICLLYTSLPGVQVHFAFDFRPLRAAAAGKKAQHKAKADGQGNKFFHSFSS